MTTYKDIYKHDPELAEVMTAQQEFVAQQVAKGVARGTANANPRGPFYIWAAGHDLDCLRVEFTKGDSHALMFAIRKCANHDIPLPEWASRAYIKAFDSVNHYHVGSWDDVFGKPVPEGKHRERLEFERRFGLSIFFDVRDAAAAGERRDDLLFADVGKKYGIGATRVKELYGKFARLPHFKETLPPPKPKRKSRR